MHTPVNEGKPGETGSRPAPDDDLAARNDGADDARSDGEVAATDAGVDREAPFVPWTEDGIDVWGDAQWDAVSSPVRMELLGLAEAEQPCSIRDLARACGRHPTSLYRHVQILVDAGLLVPCGTRPSRRRPERMYRVNPLMQGFRSWIDKDEQAADRFVSMHEAMLRAVGRGFRNMFERRWRTPLEDRPPLRYWASHDVTWIDEARGRELNEISRRLVELIEEGRRDRVGQLVQIDVMVWERLNRLIDSEDDGEDADAPSAGD